MKLVKYSASWCMPCNALKMTLADIDHPLVETMLDIDIEKSAADAAQAGVRSIPTMVLLNEDGLEVRRLNGAHSKDKILEFLA
jgi:thioredoxin 1